MILHHYLYSAMSSVKTCRMVSIESKEKTRSKLTSHSGRQFEGGLDMVTYLSRSGMLTCTHPLGGRGISEKDEDQGNNKKDDLRM